jgi:hypothetical protein
MKIRTISVGLLTVFLMIFLVGSLTILAQDQPADKRTTNTEACCPGAQSNPDCCPGADKSKMKCDPASCDTTACSVKSCSPMDKNCVKASDCAPNNANCKRVCTGK